MSNITMMPYTADERFEKTGKFNLRTKAFTGRTVTDCLLQAKQEMGADAIIVSKKTFKKGAWFGRWGGREVVEMTFGTYLPPTHPVANPNLRYGSPEPTQDAGAARMQELEAQIAGLKENLQNLSAPAHPSRPAAPFVPASLQYDRNLSGQEAVARLVAAPPTAPPMVPPAAPLASGLRRPRRKEAAAEAPVPEQGYTALMQQLLEADIAAPLAKQLISEIPAGMGGADAATYLRTLLSQRLRIANGIDALPANGKMRLLAFVGTTGVGKTTTIAKLTARFALLEKRKVGVITLDTHRIGAAEQLQKYGDILRVPVKIARDKLELIQHINDFAAEGKEIVMLDTAGRSPNEMIPLGETAHLFEGVGAIQKYLTLPAVLGQRDMENIVTKFQNIFTPDAVILTKLDEASDHTCFGRLMTLQAKYGLPLAYVTTGQKVPDDIVLPDAHAIASRILSTPLM
jgi:flagellar biosynthesis protein FlhF